MSESLVRRDVRDGVGLLTLDRPQALNALSADLVEQLADHLEALDADPTISAIVLTGSDKAFCAGADIGQITDMMSALPADTLPSDRLFARLGGMATPTIAAVRGLALGGGCEIVLACDTAVAGRSARFGVPEVKLGVIPGAGGTQRLVHAIGKAKAMRMLLSGEPVDATWACEAGLVAEVVDDGAVLDRATELARQIAGNGPLAVALAADAARCATDVPLQQGLAHERRNFLLALRTADAAEGVAAFTQRRTANFTGK